MARKFLSRPGRAVSLSGAVTPVIPPDPVSILVGGDSISDRFSDDLQNALISAGCLPSSEGHTTNGTDTNGNPVYDSGVGGQQVAEWTNGWTNNYSQNLLAGITPQFVALHAGTNNLSANGAMDPYDETQTMADWKLLFAAVHAEFPNAILFVGNMYQLGPRANPADPSDVDVNGDLLLNWNGAGVPGPQTVNSVIPSYNTALATCIGNYAGGPIHPVDLSTFGGAGGSFEFNDGVHPTGQTLADISGAYANAIKGFV